MRCIPVSITVDDESDDELSTGVAVTISIVVTFIITLVVTALITLIITSLYYKHLIDRVKESFIRQERNSHALTEGNDRANPAYGTATTIKMNTNPGYATAESPCY